MPKLGYFVYCRELQMLKRNDNQIVVPNLIEPLMFLKVPFIPTNYTLSFALGIANSVEKSNPHDFVKLDLINPKDKIVFSTGKIEIKEEIKTEHRFINLAGNLQNVQFEYKGVYKANIYMNDILLGTPEIEVDT